jgi:hypothetical protein
MEVQFGCQDFFKRVGRELDLSKIIFYRGIESEIAEMGMLKSRTLLLYVYRGKI